jgi:hypothetical protein
MATEEKEQEMATEEKEQEMATEEKEFVLCWRKKGWAEGVFHFSNKVWKAKEGLDALVEQNKKDYPGRYFWIQERLSAEKQMEEGFLRDTSPEKEPDVKGFLEWLEKMVMGEHLHRSVGIEKELLAVRRKYHGIDKFMPPIAEKPLVTPDQERWFESERVWWILSCVIESEPAWQILEYVKMLSKKSSEDHQAGLRYSRIPYDYNPYMIKSQTMRLAILLNIESRGKNDVSRRSGQAAAVLESNRKKLIELGYTSDLKTIDLDLKNFNKAVKDGYCRDVDSDDEEGE